MPQNKNKNKKKNGFFYYMLEEKKNKEKSSKGRIFPINSIAKECAISWKILTPDKKLIFENMAKNANNRTEKFTSQNVPYSIIKLRKEKELEEEKSAEQKIVEMINLSPNLQQQDFYFILFNYFCMNSDGSYIPSEVGLIKYNLQNGIVDTFNTIINKDKLPLGMNFTAKDHSEKTHQIPIPPNEYGEKDQAKIFKKIYDFAYDNKAKRVCNLITNKESVPMVKSILKMFCWDADYDEETFTVLSLSNVFHLLKKATAKSLFNADGFPSIHIAEAHIDRDIYIYKSEKSGCDFHDDLDNEKYCTLATVKRWAYTISDHCCLDLGITVIPGQHVPLGCNTATNSVKFDFNDTDSVTSETFSIPLNVKSEIDFRTLVSNDSSTIRDNLLHTYRNQDNDSPASFYSGRGRGSFHSGRGRGLLLSRPKCSDSSESSNAQQTHLLQSYREGDNDSPNSVYRAGTAQHTEVNKQKNYFATEFSNSNEESEKKLKKLFG